MTTNLLQPAHALTLAPNGPLHNRPLPVRRFAAAAALAFLACAPALGQTPNMDAGLASLVRAFKAGPAARPGPFSYEAMARRDPQGRVLVEVKLDGTVSIDRFRQTLISLGANITGENPYYRKGAFSAYVPLGTMEALGAASGLNNLSLSYKPVLNAGMVSSQGAKVMGSDVVNTGGLKGAGLTVGILSDSFDKSGGAKSAATDISTGDLPAMKFVKDLSGTGTDEGRAMAQIVHDVAPDAALCFATAFEGNASFASNIRDLRTNPNCRADVIVDDVSYLDEPFFSDGQIAQAADDVATSTTLAGKKAAYFSSAGNLQGSVFHASPAKFVPMPASAPGVNLSTIAACSPGLDVSGGVLNFGGGKVVADIVAYNQSPFVLQWDDPFDRIPSGITTDLYLVFFLPSTGNCMTVVDADNFKTNRPLEFINVAGVLKVMVGRKGPGSHLATRVKILGTHGLTWLPANTAAPAIFGQSAAANTISVAAYRYTNNPAQQSPFIPAFEPFSSPGPVTISINPAGNRLSVPLTRQKPELAAPDGVDTTFFGGDWEGNGYPNFFGTSAAAPHAAGVAALVLQKSGGSGSLTPAQVRNILQANTRPRVIPYSSSPLTTVWSLYDGRGLIDAQAATRRAVSVTLTVNPTSLAYGASAAVKINVTPAGGSGVPSGWVDLVTANGAVVQSFLLGAGAVVSSTNQLPPNLGIFGSNGLLSFPPYPVTAQYRGDSTFAAGDSAPVVVSVLYTAGGGSGCCAN